MDQSSFGALAGPQFAFYSLELWTTAVNKMTGSEKYSKITGDYQKYEYKQSFKQIIKSFIQNLYLIFL